MSTYRVVSTPLYAPAQLAIAPRYSTLEGALCDMGEGLVIAPGGHVAAFHEKHLRWMQVIQQADRS